MTLVETLLYVGLLSVFMVILVNIFVSIIELKLDTEATSPVEQTGRYLMARMSYDVNRASSITSPATLGSTGTSLSLVINGAAYTYQLSSTTILLTDGTGTASTTGSEVAASNLSFERLGNTGGKPMVRIQFTLTPTVQKVQGNQSESFLITGGLR
ncbi:MAG: hypothetical protein KGI60_02640 [Patescibacteria group bacterium]|nr:hypothetical protein [Patescibacteria group bacterium]